MKHNVITPKGLGEFNRSIDKTNRYMANMKRSHSGMYTDRFCNMKRFKKWKSSYKKLNSKYIK